MLKPIKPKSLQDITNKKTSVFKTKNWLINLDYRPEIRIKLTFFFKIFAVAMAIVFLVFGSVAAPTLQTLAANANNAEEEKRALETELQKLEAEIDRYEEQITAYKKQGNTLKNEVSLLDGKIAKLNLQINAINLTLTKLNEKINQVKSEIGITENTLSVKKDALSSALQNIYREEQEGLMTIFLQNPQLSDFFNNLNNLDLLQGNLRLTIIQIGDLKNQLEGERNQYALARADAADLQAYQVSQREGVSNTKKEKADLLAETKGQESKYQQLLVKTKESASEIRKRIFQLLGGGELSFEQAYEYAKLASRATGVRAALILAVLDRESAMGQNVGRCNYKTAMSSKDKSAFLEIVESLGISPDTVTVSCPNKDGIYGGAMGPAQFIPTTWKIYDDEVAKITGHSPANPWNNADAFIASALYLKNAGALTNEKTAAARYYCGGNWNRYICTGVYARKVIDQANRFEEDISAISS